jgi:hypothetical protein
MAAATERAKSIAARWNALADSGIHEKVNEERRRLWHALHELTRLEGGKVVSPPFQSPLRIQLDPKNTTLIPKLQYFGYQPSLGGDVSIFDGKHFIQHNIILVDLPSLHFLAGLAG